MFRFFVEELAFSLNSVFKFEPKPELFQSPVKKKEKKPKVSILHPLKLKVCQLALTFLYFCLRLITELRIKWEIEISRLLLFPLFWKGGNCFLKCDPPQRGPPKMNCTLSLLDNGGSFCSFFKKTSIGLPTDSNFSFLSHIPISLLCLWAMRGREARQGIYGKGHIFILDLFNIWNIIINK